MAAAGAAAAEEEEEAEEYLAMSSSTATGAWEQTGWPSGDILALISGDYKRDRRICETAKH